MLDSSISLLIEIVPHAMQSIKYLVLEKPSHATKKQDFMASILIVIHSY